MVLAAASALVLTAAVAALAVWFLKPSAPKPVSCFAMSLPPGQHVLNAVPGIAISPDGTRLVYAAGDRVAAMTGVQLYLGAMDGLEARAIPGTEGGMSPFFFARWQMGWVLRGRQAEEGFFERGTTRHSC